MKIPHPIAAAHRGVRKLVFVVVGIHSQAEADLAKVADVSGSSPFLFGGTQDWQKQRREDGDDGNDHQQLDQGESLAGRWWDLIALPILFCSHNDLQGPVDWFVRTDVERFKLAYLEWHYDLIAAIENHTNW